jgi:hypothetical protein
MGFYIGVRIGVHIGVHIPDTAAVEHALACLGRPCFESTVGFRT